MEEYLGWKNIRGGRISEGGRIFGVEEYLGWRNIRARRIFEGGRIFGGRIFERVEEYL